jgi:adenosine deaminase
MNAAPTLATPELTAFVHALPKMELHCHLLGTVRKHTFIELVQRAQAPLALEEIEAFYTRGDKPVGVLRVLRALDQWLLRSPDDLHRITYEYLQDAAAHNVRYAEFFWNPTGTVQSTDMSYAQAQAAILAGAADAQTDCGIRGRLVPSIDREAPAAAALEMVQWMRAHRHDEVPGIGIDYRENERPPELFIDAYALARQSGLKTTAHASEFGLPWHNLQTALDVLQVDRIDHGYTVVDNLELAQRCADKGMVFTVVPTNSYYLRTLAPERWALDHPIRRMPGLGLRVHPNTDDPTLHHVDPTGAWTKMVCDFGFSIDDLRGFMHNGIDAAWISDSEKRSFQQAWNAEFDALRSQHLGAAATAAAAAPATA